ncbi:HEAT repeat domain-containing protein [Parashewanella curva]|uniref:HEAT repeat domain-containing protein n=1 Tax=Parashewanella curva TaxID=2338552 RepID=A0A3L8Q0I7_9GAMM|nr:HEAT repeat domain-containing protein [Parashewanella curva]RLV60539.1 HEAT repeat domain-containing protein [Parashewanella curva]
MKKIITVAASVFLGVAIQGCAPSSYNVKEPIASNIAFVKQQNAGSLQFEDHRHEDQKIFSFGVLPAGLMLGEEKLEPISYLQNNTVKELQARGVNLDSQNLATTQVKINKLLMRNHRTNGYTPFITLTMLSADVETDAGTKRLGFFIKRGKVPVWSFNEVIQPTLNEPLSLLVKEFSAKLNKYVYKGQMSDTEVTKLIDKIKNSKDKKTKYLDVYQLGFSNNPSAIPYVYELSQTGDEYVRMAAISSLGILGANEHFDDLKRVANNGETWTDRAMALKAIGDLGTDEAKAFLMKMTEQLNTVNSHEQIWSSEIIRLYL